MKKIRKILTFIFFLSMLISCSQEKNRPLTGYIEGEYTYMASGIAGTLFTLDVKRGQQVEKNQLLFTLDPEPDKAAMEAIAANVQQLEAEVSLAAVVLKRYLDLLKHHAADQNTVDEKQTDFDSKSKQLEAAKKNLAESNWAYRQKIVYAPYAGYVEDTFYRTGEKVGANQPVLSILAPYNIKVLFYIPERALSTIHLGQKIQFSCDGCQNKTTATISYISTEAEYTPPIIYSQDTRYKLVYLVRAELPEKIAVKFHPGQPLDIYLHE
ncbi:MAG TPA: efflux RND transporter periplasmic adaptor subunit [Gammaproteobacteria bacterium]|nr:efflux RND transporter periplasmic adaptor subunit [Gammaproteobacteria bacterium]